MTSDEIPPAQPQGNPFAAEHTHPWRRYFAKHVDVTLAIVAIIGLMVGVVLLTGPAPAWLLVVLGNPFVAVILFVAIWVPLEAVLLATLGTTPARWIFGITVRGIDGGKLSLEQSLKRSALFAIQGLGLGIPIIAIFTQYFGYRRLTHTGTTLWDTAAESVVTHVEWGFGRALACTLVAMLMMCVQVVGALMP